MRYENYLRGQDSKTKCYSFTLDHIKNTQIEHIVPQTESGEKLASGIVNTIKIFMMIAIYIA